MNERMKERSREKERRDFSKKDMTIISAID
jgi:hypothetical protein